jgi:pimeloyl-ACP methyl ester carboxylesterase
MIAFVRFCLVLFALWLTTGCAIQPAPTVPMERLYYGSDDAKHRTLVVFLPGGGDLAKDFANKGWVRAMETRNIAMRAVAAGAYYGYYQQGSFIERLREDVIKPARAEGYDRIWLVGMSMGGWGSLLYAREHPEDIIGIVLLAPFIAPGKTIDEIYRAGGLDAWQPQPIEGEHDSRTAIKWLKDYRGGPGEPRVYIGYGQRDRFARSIQLLRARLPAENIIEVIGGHEWTTWNKLWKMFLDRGILAVKP